MYVPPHRRNKGPTEEHPATLEELSASHSTGVEIKPEFTSGGPFDVEGCPFDTEGSNDDLVIFYEYSSGIEGRRALLEWFKAKSEQPSEAFPQGDIKALLRMPSRLTKQERAAWHKDAEALKLGSASEGTGAGRHLCIFTAALASIGMGNLKSMLPRETQKEVKRVWDICQTEGGKFWDYSQDEIAELFMSKTGLPEEIRHICRKRDEGRALCKLIRDGEVDGALGILVENQKVAHIRDDVSGGFPIHLACFKNLEPVVARLLEIPGVLEQRDAMRCSALDVAKAYGFDNLTTLLESRGMICTLSPGDEKELHLLGENYNSWHSKGDKAHLMRGRFSGRVKRGNKPGGQGRECRMGSEENSTGKW